MRWARTKGETTHIHPEQAGDEGAGADAHGADRDLEVEGEQLVAVGVEDELDDLLRRLDVALGAGSAGGGARAGVLTEMASASFTISSTCFEKDSRRTSRSSWSWRGRGLPASLSLRYMAARSSSASRLSAHTRTHTGKRTLLEDFLEGLLDLHAR